MEQENLVAVFLLVVEDLDTVPFKDSSEWLSNTFDAGKKIAKPGTEWNYIGETKRFVQIYGSSYILTNLTDEEINIDGRFSRSFPSRMSASCSNFPKSCIHCPCLHKASLLASVSLFKGLKEKTIKKFDTEVS